MLTTSSTCRVKGACLHGEGIAGSVAGGLGTTQWLFLHSADIYMGTSSELYTLLGLEGVRAERTGCGPALWGLGFGVGTGRPEVSRPHGQISLQEHCFGEAQ